MADLLLHESDAPRWYDRVRQEAHPLLGSSLVTIALVVVGVVSLFVPVVGVVAIAMVTTLLLHSAIRAAVNR
ncbi:MAG: hypothetical protein QOE35_3940 [Actinomycetota bacterium]|jgi:hypothetical protein